jgi:hypothetical protein
MPFARSLAVAALLLVPAMAFAQSKSGVDKLYD